MRKLAGLVAAVMAVALTLPALADHGTPAENGNCPEPKVETVDQAWIPTAGTHLCIKGATKIVFVTADGVSTVKTLLGSVNQNGQLQDVSHYAVIGGSTTTTSEPDETTTTVEDTTTTTVGETTTTTLPSTNLPCVVDCSPPDTVPVVVTTPATTPAATTPDVLPFTGINIGLVALAAVGMLGLGTVLAWTFRDRLS